MNLRCTSRQIHGQGHKGEVWHWFISVEHVSNGWRWILLLIAGVLIIWLINIYDMTWNNKNKIRVVWQQNTRYDPPIIGLANMHVNKNPNLRWLQLAVNLVCSYFRLCARHTRVNMCVYLLMDLSTVMHVMKSLPL